MVARLPYRDSPAVCSAHVSCTAVQAAESKRCLQYTDERLVGLARRYEVEAVKRGLEAAKRELNEAIRDVGSKAKFELLHDEVRYQRCDIAIL